MSQLSAVPCPLCESTEFLVANNTTQDGHIQKYGALYEGVTRSQWRVCGQCGFVFQNPRPSAEALNDFYSQSDYHEEIPESWQVVENFKTFSHWYYDEKIDYALQHAGLKTGRVFDIGFGHGGALLVFASRGWETAGVEPDASAFDYARDKLGLTGLERGLLGADTQVASKVDLVFSNHTFEHIADLDDVMRGIQHVLKPGGYVFTAVPTYASNRSSQSLLWMNSAHYSMFTGPSLSRLFAKYGLEEVAYTYRGWHKEIDDLWHVARFTGKTEELTEDLARHHENPAEVARFINRVNPLRSMLHFPFYSNYPRRVERRTRLAHVARVLRANPGAGVRKAARLLMRIAGRGR